jgi:hypothetical protein
MNRTPPPAIRSPRLPRWALPVIAVVVLGGGFVGGLIFGQAGEDQRSRPAPAAPTPAISNVAPDDHSADGLPYPDVPRITIADMQARRDAGSLLLVDARSAEQFAAGHAEGALLLGSPELDARLASLESGALIVTYCT